MALAWFLLARLWLLDVPIIHAGYKAQQDGQAGRYWYCPWVGHERFSHWVSFVECHISRRPPGPRCRNVARVARRWKSGDCRASRRRATLGPGQLATRRLM